ncbi:MAG: glycosyltransferase family 4 protein [Bacteroidaceae bacterium]|nr:glycosyltransferase family 4 protein [Bacteroidaceae bacterium]
MRVLIVNTTERTGGAAIAANRLAKALRQEGVEVATATRKGRWAFYWERLRIALANRSRKNLWLVDIANRGEDITKTSAFREADVVHLHWVNQGFLSLGTIEKILRSGKRVVWTLHDQWPYAGICHYAEGCDRFQTACHRCPQLAHPGARDLSHKVFEAKRRIYGQGNITFVGCSQWIADEARRSALTKGQRVVAIPNAIDHTVFRPIPKREARRQFGLPEEGPIVLFICQKVTDERKGVRYLDEAMKQLPDVRVIRVGKGGDYEIREEQRMALLYAAADVFVTPSLQDNLPNTIVEAMSCGTPCVGFRVGGIPEMIHHQTDGYVARYRDANDLAQGIRYVLSHPELSEAAARYARETYDEHRVAQLYMKEYE